LQRVVRWCGRYVAYSSRAAPGWQGFSSKDGALPLVQGTHARVRAEAAGVFSAASFPGCTSLTYLNIAFFKEKNEDYPFFVRALAFQ